MGNGPSNFICSAVDSIGGFVKGIVGGLFGWDQKVAPPRAVRAEMEQMAQLVGGMTQRFEQQMSMVRSQHESEMKHEVERERAAALESYKLEQQRLQDEDRRRKENDERQQQEEAQQRMKERARKLGIDTNALNIGIVGQSGVGKSSLVNAFIGKDVAATGIIETTTLPAGYPLAFNLSESGQRVATNNNPSTLNRSKDFMIWDIPGRGTPTHPDKTYYHENCLFYMDCLIIVQGNRICEFDLDFANQALENDQCVVFARTRSDQTADEVAMKRYNDEHFDRLERADKKAIEDDIRATVLRDFERQIAPYNKLSRVPFYIVSSKSIKEERQMVPAERRRWPQMDEARLLDYLSNHMVRSRNIRFKTRQL